MQGACNRDQRAIRGAKAGQRRVRPHVGAELVERGLGGAAHRPPVDRASPPHVSPAGEQILRDGHDVEQAEILVDEAQSSRACPRGRDLLGRDLVGADGDPAAALAGMHAGEDLDQRRLAGTVATEQRSDFALGQLE